MKGPEAKFWTLLKNHKEALPGEVGRVENVAGAGDPDLSCACGRDYFVELKAVDRKITEKDKALSGAGLKPLFEPSQQPWHARRVRHGTIIFVLVKYADAMTLWLCEAAGLYGLLCVVRKTKGTFDYSYIRANILDQLGK